MSTYYEISISHTLHTDIYDAIYKAIQTTENTFDVIDLVHLLDYWEELRDEAAAKNDLDFQNWVKQQQMFEKNAQEIEDIFLFHKIKDILNNNCVEKDAESEFYLICDLAEMFEKEWNKRIQEE